MWLNLPPAVRIYVAAAPVDLRKSFDGLAAAVSHVLAHDPFEGHLFVFFNRRADRVKVLWWDGDGFALFYKRTTYDADENEINIGNGIETLKAAVAESPVPEPGRTLLVVIGMAGLAAYGRRAARVGG